MKNNEKMISDSMKNIKSIRQKIKIRMIDYFKEINAYCFGNFAYHQINGNNNYGITHIPTGYSIKKGLSMKKAKELAFRLFPIEDEYNETGECELFKKLIKVLKDFEERNPILFEESEFHFKEKDFQIK